MVSKLDYEGADLSRKIIIEFLKNKQILIYLGMKINKCIHCTYQKTIIWKIIQKWYCYRIKKIVNMFTSKISISICGGEKTENNFLLTSYNVLAVNKY